MLYFANAADNLFAIERRAGQGVWHVHRTPAFGMEISGYAGPSFDRGTIFFAFSDGHVGAYDARDGSERWPAVDLSAEAEQSQGSEGVRYLDVDTTPVPDDLGEHGGAVVFVASFVGGVFAIDQERGTTVWRADKVAGVTELTLWHEPGHRPHEGSPDFVPGGPPVPSRELLIASSGTTGLWALDPMTGRSAWHIPVPEGGVTAPAIVGGALLVGTTRYGAFLLSPRDGRPMDGVDLGSGFSQTPVAFGGRAYLFSNAGTILALEIDPPLRPQRDTWTWP
jgi:outer membrane protein assembly factor BamB